MLINVTILLKFMLTLWQSLASAECISVCFHFPEIGKQKFMCDSCFRLFQQNPPWLRLHPAGMSSLLNHLLILRLCIDVLKWMYCSGFRYCTSRQSRHIEEKDGGCEREDIIPGICNFTEVSITLAGWLPYALWVVCTAVRSPSAAFGWCAAILLVGCHHVTWFDSHFRTEMPRCVVSLEGR